MLNGPELWDLILGDMPEGAVIAGGAVRDYLLGVEPKDIDVFYAWPAPSEELPPINLDNLELHFVSDPRVGLHRIDDYYKRQEEYTAMTNINLVSSGVMYGFKVDAVEMTEMKDGFDLVEGFDFAINQCWYDSNMAGMGQLAASRRDMAENTVTLLSNDRRERSLARFARFNERHAGAYTFVDLT